MPSHSPLQAKTMAAIAHGWHPKGSAAGIPVSVAKEFHEADAGKKWGAHRDSGGQTLGNPWMDASFAGPLMETGLLNSQQPSQHAGLVPGSWIGPSQGPAPDPGQGAVFPDSSVAPSFTPATPSAAQPQGGGPVSWDQPSFAGDKWSNMPGKAMGGPMAPAMQMARKPMAGLGNAMPRPSIHPAMNKMVPHAMGRDLGGMTKPPNMGWQVRNEARGMLHSGPISSVVPGRTDRHNTQVASGSYVLPADAVSHIGQNNTKAGHAILSSMFGHSGPYGSGMPSIKHGPGPPHAAKAAQIPAAHIPKFQSAGGKDGHPTGEPVPVVVAGGEFTIPPEVVAQIGGGDVHRGHRVLDKWVMALRKKHIATLRGLPPPAKD